MKNIGFCTVGFFKKLLFYSSECITAIPYIKWHFILNKTLFCISRFLTYSCRSYDKTAYNTKVLNFSELGLNFLATSIL